MSTDGTDSDSPIEGVTAVWKTSPPPTEDFSNAEGANDEGEWPFEIVAEEVGCYDDVLYEVEWGNWQREDGSKSTWETFASVDTKRWDSDQRKRRKALSSRSREVELPFTVDIHNNGTRYRAQAYEEKLKKEEETERDPLPQRMAKLLAEKSSLVHGDARISRSSVTPSLNTRSTSTRRQPPETTSNRDRSTASLPSFGSSTTKSSRFPSSPPTSVISASSGAKVHLSTVKVKAKVKTPSRTRPRSPSPIVQSSSQSRSLRPSSSSHQDKYWTPKSKPSRSTSSHASNSHPRNNLQAEWTKIARASGAASIRFINDVGGEEIPSLDPDFQYIEADYIYSEDVTRIENEAFFVTCQCNKKCNVSRCGCQEPSNLVDENGRKISAYTPDGLFKFNVPRGTEVIECNKFCFCDDNCPNRVAQKPRNIEIEIFKTLNRGWGVRPGSDVRKGKVLGIYSGALILREGAVEIENRGFIFDLDGNENPDDDPPENAYSVDSLNCGNWTRFINHSCSPNVTIFEVVYDTVPDMNIPYLAFVAMEDIPAHTEFTFDYNPAATKLSPTKGKNKTKIPKGAKPCECGSIQCRGFLI